MKAVLLDRDGTIIVEPPGERLVSQEDTKLFPDTLEALGLLANLGFAAILVTNQAGIAEGLITEEEFHKLNDGVIEMLKPSGINILKTYLCPHGPTDECVCRKPKPTMILEAAKEFDINLAESYMVGDRLSDIEAGFSAGTKTVLVKTGNAVVQSGYATFTAANLLEAARYIVNH